MRLQKMKRGEKVAQKACCDYVDFCCDGSNVEN